MNENQDSTKIRRVLMTASDKTGLAELGQAFAKAGAEIVATGKTATILKEAGLKVTPIEEVTGSPEAFQGRMKTLSFQVCSGILYRRGDTHDEKDLAALKIQPIDAVVVNFYPFEKAVQKPGIERAALIDEVDIGGPTLVRAAAKNAPDVLVLTDPSQYPAVIQNLKESGRVSKKIAMAAAEEAWEKILGYDAAIARVLGSRRTRSLRYGENPHQKGLLEFNPGGPIAWEEKLTSTELSYNNILDLSSAYALASDLKKTFPNHTGVVIVKHNNACGVAWVPKSEKVNDPKQSPGALQKLALLRAWDGDPISAFGGVLVFTDPLEQEAKNWLSEKFVELVAAPDLTREGLQAILTKRKNLKAVCIREFGHVPAESMVVVPGGRLFQSSDEVPGEEPIRSVTKREFTREKWDLGRFGIAISKSLKSNALALVREIPESEGLQGGFQLVGTGQGQPNRVEALERLAIPRAQGVLRASSGRLGDCILVSDAFFPFRDTVDVAYQAGIRFIIQPGGSMKDQDSIQACDEHEMAMAFTGYRHFKH
ncbi:MAG: bifunctional phosphoribosylaminoimidazolecarboxamide formyltransferase/IMP cyclohydrolase [Bdellovibrionales bacterium]|nr:bifunctional phosphoribosylaminoimidazolecarboxamide formyltransferase/IMP cyclohydrolase [Bdellovibrionales bacterium]